VLTTLRQWIGAKAEPQYSPNPRQRLLIATAIALLGVAYLLTLRPGQGWGDDFAMYLLQARNLAAGQWSPPAEPIYNPHVAFSPEAYPPVFPLMLAPLYRIWGFNLLPMKVEVVVCFLVGLYFWFECLSRQLPFRYAACAILALALSPYLWQFKDSVLSDLPFLMLCALALCVIQACERNRWRSFAPAMAAAVCVYLCYATRTVGVVLIACLALSAVPRNGERRLNAAIATSASLLLIGAHTILSRGTRSYLNHLGSPLREIPHNLLAYSWSIRHHLLGFSATLPGLLFLIMLAALGIAGLLLRLRQGLGLSEAFTIAYGLLVLLWSSEEDLRLLIPILPMCAFYIAVAIGSIPGRLRPVAAAILMTTLVVGYVSRYRTMDAGPIRDGLGDPAFTRICDYIREQTGPADNFVFAKARLLSLLTGRRAAAYQKPADGAELLAYFRTISARYILVNRNFRDDAGYLEPLVTGGPSPAREIRSEGPYHLYALP
jgi:hypothetical protein